VPYDKKAPVEVQVAQSFATSLKNLQTDYVDSLVLHSPIAPYETMIKVWRAMETIYHSGSARQLGISNCYETDLIEALSADVQVKPAILQNRFYQATGYDIDLRRWCADSGVIYQCFWTLTANPHLLSGKTIQTIALKTHKTPAQILFRYLNQSGAVPLTGTTSDQHMAEDLAIVEFELVSADIESIDRLLIPFIQKS
jgi:diketogulonate reductase-like aldo/keto reductase